MHRHSGWRRCVIIGPNSTAITTPDRLTHSTVMTSMRYDSQFKEVRQSFNSACFCLAPRTASFSTLDACSPLESTPLLEVLSAAQYYVVLHIYVEIPTALPNDSIAGEDINQSPAAADGRQVGNGKNRRAVPVQEQAT